MKQQAKIEQEKIKNPFYQTLKAQKEERDQFIDFYESQINELPRITQEGEKL